MFSSPGQGQVNVGVIFFRIINILSMPISSKFFPFNKILTVYCMRGLSCPCCEIIGQGRHRVIIYLKENGQMDSRFMIMKKLVPWD